DNAVKIPAGWLIEKAGLKGESVGGAVVYESNCLVITNKGNATFKDVRDLARKIIKSVNNRFAITLQPEVNFISSDIEVIILGSGTSKGVPEAGCFCDVCMSKDIKDKRKRSSILINTMGTTILIDSSPDFRQQAIDNEILNIDAVLFTHSHADHVGGIDDLRPYCIYGDLPLYMQKDVNDDLHRRIDYCFKENPYPGVPRFDVKEISTTPFYINGIKIMPIRIMHGSLPILGFRIGNFAYITDAKTVPEEERWKLENLDVLILNALRYKEHFSHLSVPEAMDLVDELKPKETFLTHLSHLAPAHIQLDKLLPENIHPAYDGLKIVVK
ncbi:MAG: MBL fold metallo-hydrolase, partial [Muribaculaceae bacterium]|nr:MBL fold metallo-hydrolase [Muribaculaceae bacterium]